MIERFSWHAPIVSAARLDVRVGCNTTLRPR